MGSETTILERIAYAVVAMDEDNSPGLCQQALDEGIAAVNVIDGGLVKGMDRAGQLFEDEEYFIPELLLCSDAMYAGLDVVRPHLPVAAEGEKTRVVIGVVEGDTHDIGKNLVKIMLEAAGFAVEDLGRDVPPERFVDAAVEFNAEFIAMATLMTTTMPAMERVIQILKERGIRERFQVLVGGGPITGAFAKKIGADGTAPNAPAAVALARKLHRSAA